MTEISPKLTTGKEKATVSAMLRERAQSNPDAPAIFAVGLPVLTYGELDRLTAGIASALQSLGIARNDRVAIVLPNGPEMATAFLSVASCATSAPLNPGYRAEEFEFYLSDLNAKALVVKSGVDSPARGVARKLGIPVLELSSVESGAAGVFTVNGEAKSEATAPVFAEPDDIALVLHTSGTTSRPKIVPLTHANVCASARNVATTLQLSEADRCLNIMPLFHIHGLIAATLASLWAGAGVVCTPGFVAPSFFDWMDACEPTWYTAVPTMHQAILARAEGNQRIIARRRLRLIRSSSSPLPPQVMEQLERTFGAPVIEAYGMTEAAHQMASNPLPPRTRKAGTVGLPAGPEVAIMDEAGKLLANGETGEIVIRGENVTPGYDNNPEANAGAFTNGWFRTGDQGKFDDEGYLSLTGRLKEIINRGGEKISPREVDEVILDHPAVAQVVTFAVPDPKLGESVGAAIVLKAGQEMTDRDVRQFAALRLADFKVPRTIVFLDEIPKGPTGKLQRIGLAEKLGIDAAPTPGNSSKPYVAPETAVEKLLAEIWMEVLRVEKVGVNDAFLEIGGDSILAGQLVSRISDRLDLNLTVASFFETPTIAEQSVLIEEVLLADA